MRRCERCGDKLDALARSDARYCSTRCRVAAHRASKIPAEMCGKRWTRADGKRPVMASGAPAASTDSRTWASFATVQSGAGDGFGVMLGGGLGCYDLDHVTDDEARAIIATIPERIIFTERSVSGEGVHVFVEAPESAGWRRGNVERYTMARFIRVTLNRF